MLRIYNNFSIQSCLILLITVAVPLPSEALTLDQAIDRALKSDLERDVVEQKLQAWKQKAKRTGQWDNPTFSVSGASDQATNDRGKEVQSVEISQRFPVTDRISQQRIISRLEWKQAQAELREYDRNLINTVKRTYSSLVFKNKILTFYNRQIDRLNTIIEMGERFLDRGELSRLEWNMMQMRRDKIKKHRDRVRQNLIEERGKLKTVLNVPSDRNLKVSATPIELKQKTQQTVDTEVRLTRPDLQKRQFALEQVQTELKREQSRAWDDWEVSMGYDREETPDGNEENTVNLGLSIPFPLWNQNNAMRAFKKQMIDVAERSVVALQRRIDQNVHTLKNKLSIQKQTFQRYTDTILPRAQRQEKLSRQGFERGRIKASEFLRMSAQLFDARRAYYREFQDLNELYIQYEHITGHAKHLKTDFLKGQSQ